mmetsp:Transcript_48955/g.116411  ORF Transcript_48955/g.116411 Transcript_48955/m.116411 type:complete len:471 (+) Transcript_48955:76-1488(+)
MGAALPAQCCCNASAPEREAAEWQVVDAAVKCSKPDEQQTVSGPSGDIGSASQGLLNAHKTLPQMPKTRCPSTESADALTPSTYIANTESTCGTSSYKMNEQDHGQEIDGELACGTLPEEPSNCVEQSVVEEVERLLELLKVEEAAKLLASADSSSVGAMSRPSRTGETLADAIALQMRVLEDARQTLQAGGADATPCSQADLLSQPSFFSKNSRQSSEAIASPSGKRRDMVKVNFDLDDQGRRVDAVIEFFRDGSASIRWTAQDLPIQLARVVSLVHEVDLLGELAPYIESSSVLHQFPWSPADRMVRVVSKPPIPFVSGMEAIAQRFGYDLLDTFGGLCLVETSPNWDEAEGAYRGVPKPPLFRSGLREIEVKRAVALGCPSGQHGELTSITFVGKGKLMIPRKLLPDWLISQLVKFIGVFIFRRALERIAAYEGSEHWRRVQESNFYANINSRIDEYLAAKNSTDSR